MGIFEIQLVCVIFHYILYYDYTIYSILRKAWTQYLRFSDTLGETGMKLGIAGTGKIVQEALPVILDAAQPEQTVLMGRENSEERTERLTAQYGLAGYVLDFDALLESDADVIYIALPNQLHYETARRALLAGKHVIVEKPAAVVLTELQELCRLAAQQHKIFVEAMTLHHLPAWKSLREKVSELGEIRLVCFQFCQYSSRYDAFLRGEIAPSFDPACAGCALTDHGVYNLHAIVDLFGSPRQVSYAPNLMRGVDTSGILTMAYSGFQAVSIAAKDCQAPVSSTIQGTEGCIRIPVPANGLNRYEVYMNGQPPRAYDFTSDRHRMYWEFQEFARMIRELDFSSAARLQTVSLGVVRILDSVRRV